MNIFVCLEKSNEGDCLPKQKTHEQFIAELLRVNPSIIPLETYVKSSVPILCKCNVCGIEWKSRPNNLLQGDGCPVCGISKRAQSQTKSREEFTKELKEIAPNLELISQYDGARRYVIVKCKNCGNEWKALPTNLLKGRNCPECAKIVRADKKRRTENEFQELLSTLHPDIMSLDNYIGNQKQIRFSCKKCGYVWKTSPSSILSGHGCPRCAGNGIYSQEEFIKKVNEINPYIEIIGEYQRSNIPILCRCKLCGNEWKSRPNNIISGKGCPKCYHSTTSFIQEAIFNALSIAAQEKKVLARDRKTIGKELDIVIPELKIAIEPGSWKWHKSIIDKDYKKRELCAEKGIRLIFIYTDYPDENPPFSKDCYVYHETIGFEQDLPVLKEIVSVLLGVCNISYPITDDEWNEITNKAYQDSRRRTTSEFVKMVAEKNPTISVEGEYTGAWNRIQVRCLKCGFVWSPSANSLLQGNGCRRCASIASGKKKRKTEQVFLSEMAVINPSIRILSPYNTTNTYVLCECRNCKHQWESLPSNLIKGKGCPICSREKNAISRRKNPDVFSKQLFEKNPNIELLSKYEKSTSKIECRCKICNNRWQANPSDLLSGIGCPKCSYIKRAEKKQKKVILIETGQVFDSVQQAADYVGTTYSNISACLHGKTKTAKGFHWKFAEPK